MKILRVIDTLDPRTGGPVAGLRALTPVLQALGHETVVVTTDLPGHEFAPLPGAEVIPLGPARGHYRFTPALAPWLGRNLPRFDAVIVHGVWQSLGRTVRPAARRHRIPYFVYPHGMLDPWFSRAFPSKRLKKWLYWRLAERFVIRDAAAVLFTCEEERRLARESFSPYACDERVVTYGTESAPPAASRQIAAWHAQQPGLVGRPFLLFLGRIHPKKGVDLLLAAWLALVRRRPGIPDLVIAGPAEDPALLRELQARANAAPEGARVHWAGMLEGDAKWGALRAAEALVLPSHQENFGLVVTEALAAGTPVLLSTQVNIWREIVADGAGLAAPDTAEGVSSLLDQWTSRPRSARTAMRRQAAACHEQRFRIEAVAQSFLEALAPYADAGALHLRA